jgi:hypothetical protein
MFAEVAIGPAGARFNWSLWSGRDRLYEGTAIRIDVSDKRFCIHGRQSAMPWQVLSRVVLQLFP